MAICEDAPCCGCCGTIAWAREAQAEQEYAQDGADDYDAAYHLYGGYDDDEVVLCGFCESLVVVGTACSDCDTVAGEEVA